MGAISFSNTPETLLQDLRTAMGTGSGLVNLTGYLAGLFFVGFRSIGTSTYEVTVTSLSRLYKSIVTGDITTMTFSQLQDAENLREFQPEDANLTAIAELTGTSGFLKKTGEGAWELADVSTGSGGGSDIISVPDQYVRITDLDSGIYRLTYEGTKYIYYSGATSSSALDFNLINPIYLYVNKKQAATDGEAYWDWHIFGTRGVGNYVLYLYYGIVKISSGSYSSLDLSSIIRTTNVENNLDTSTHSSTKVLSAYQGYLLDQNKQNKTDETLETTDKTIVGAINELNGKSGTPKLYAPTIKISGLTLTIKNPTKNKDYVASYDIYNADTNTLIRNTKKTTVDLESFNIADGTYNIAVKAKGIEFNGTLLYEESDYSNVLSYTHDNPPTLANGSAWYKATVDKSTITEITFDNTYEVTGNETESWDASASRDGSVMCYLNDTSITIKPIHTTNKVHANTNCMYLFRNFSNITTINNFIALDTLIVRNMYGMFSNCHTLTTLDMSNFDTSSVTDMSVMFADCYALTTLDISNFDTSNVTTMYGIFSNCEALTILDVSGFDTSSVTNMNNMFNGCNALTTLDVSSFDTSNVTNMYGMFYGCNTLTTLDVSNFDTSNVTDMGYMFNSCNALTTLDVTGFDTSDVTDMSFMFYDCNKLTADCSS